MTKYFQDCGVALGLVSYPYDIDGHDLYTDVFENRFFEKYKDGINRYSENNLAEYLYKPKGYRLFGNYGLAILSLIDDFAFCDRIFHANHGYGQDENIPNYRYYCRIITGVTSFEQKDYLQEKAEETFLRKDGRYPFIGIIKLKINYTLLLQHGISLTEYIKKEILLLSDCQNENLNSIVVDCFDNDELTVISFSNSIPVINTFFSQVRDFTFDGFDSNYAVEKEGHRHVFISSHTNIGYDIGYEFNVDSERAVLSNPLFIPAKDIENIKIKLIWEGRVGHYNVFKNLIQSSFSDCEIMEDALTGGNTMSHYIQLSQIHNLEELCRLEEIKHNVKRVKIVLNWQGSNYIIPEREKMKMRKASGSLSHLAFKPSELDEIRNYLNQCRISKILRERLLKIYGLFNESIRDDLHSGYFIELAGALSRIKQTLCDFSKSENVKIGDIDYCLSEFITSIEEAYYNRFHQKDMRDTNLEYNGGIQQHLTSYDFAYKEILRILSPQKIKQKADESFISISGYEKVASIRANLRININQISYPELFAISVWKEACNFEYPLSRKELDSKEQVSINEDEAIYFSKYSVWTKFKERKESFINIRSILKNESFFDNNDDTYNTVAHFLDKETVEYLFIDSFSYHFGFYQNYELFYHSYWKYFLQISQHYDRNGRIEKDYFISYLLRIFIVGLRSYIAEDGSGQIKQMNDFLKKQRFIPFDPVLSDLWLLCYEKVYKCAEVIWHELNKFYFEEVTNNEINAIELLLIKNEKEIEEINKYEVMVANWGIVSDRKTKIEAMKENIKAGKLALYNDDLDSSYKMDDYLICFFNAYLLAIKELDEEDVEPVIKCLPRNAQGEIQLNDYPQLKGKISNLPVDPLGGIFITDSDIRGEYFRYRSSFYRSLWNYAMTKRKMPVSNSKS